MNTQLVEDDISMFQTHLCGMIQNIFDLHILDAEKEIFIQTSLAESSSVSTVFFLSVCPEAGWFAVEPVPEVGARAKETAPSKERRAQCVGQLSRGLGRVLYVGKKLVN